MQEMIRISTHPEFKEIVDRLLDLQGADGIVLSVQPNTKGQVFVGMHGQFVSLNEFREYLQRSGLPFESSVVNGWKNYVMKKGLIEAEFYKLD